MRRLCVCGDAVCGQVTGEQVRSPGGMAREGLTSSRSQSPTLSHTPPSPRPLLPQFNRMAGFDKSFKPHWVVVMNHYPLQRPGQPRPAVRRTLWVYSNKTCETPRTRLWLDGAQAFMAEPKEGREREGILVSACVGGCSSGCEC